MLFRFSIGRWNALFVLPALLFAPIITNAQVTVLSRATLIDGAGGAPQKEVSIVIEGGRIRDLGPRPRSPRRRARA